VSFDQREGAFRRVVLCASALAFCLSPALAQSQESQFLNMQGAWSGDGVITVNDGRSERIRCRAKYFVSPSGHSIDQQLRCASDSYRFDVNSGLVLQQDGSIAGVWTESTRNITGHVNARVNEDSIDAKISGPGFTADMIVTTDADHQSVQISPNGGDIRSVAIDMNRS
jgi:hypothetical protein